MNTAIASVLNKVLGDFVDGFNPQQLNISLFSGKLQLTKMKIKPQALEQFGLPVVLRYGVINSIEATIPWTSLSSSPLKVEVKGVYLLFSPKTPDLWSNESVQQSLLDRKSSRLARFEFLSSDQLAATQAPGFLEKLVTKIIDNLQVSLSNVYIRLEDFTSSSEPFATGIIIKSAEIATCNSSWTPEFVIDSSVTYKSAEVCGLALYMDYGAGCEVDSSKIPGKTPEQSFENLSRQESSLHFLIKHRFILASCSCTWRLTLNKDAHDLSQPQIALIMTLGSPEEGIKCGTELKQVTHTVKFWEFCEKFSSFSAGVEATFVCKDFTDIEGGEYRRLYLEWFLKPSEDRPSLESDLKVLEKVYTFEGIVMQRQAAKAELKLMEQEEEAKRLMSAVAAAAVTSGGFLGYFGFGKSKEAQEQAEAERKRKVEAAEMEIRKAREARERFSADLASFLENTPTFEDLPSTYERFFFKIVLNSTIWTLITDEKELISSYLAGSQCEIHIRVTGIKISLNFASFTLIDHIDHSDIYPQFLESSNCSVEYVDFPEAGKTLEITTGDSFCTLNFVSIFTLISSVQSVIIAELDVDHYREMFEGKVRDLVQKGKDYMKMIAREGIAPETLLVSISCKAPCFIIPHDVREKRALIADFGLLTLRTRPATRDWDERGDTQPREAVYDSYLFTASDFVLATLWDFSAAKQWKSGHVDNVVAPSPLVLNVESAVFPEINPAIEVTAEMESMNGAFSDIQFQFVMQLKDRILALKEKILPSGDPAPVSETEGTDQEILKDQMKIQERLLSQRVTLDVKSVNLDLIAGGQCISQFSLTAFRTELNLYPSSQLQVRISMLGIAVKDKRPEQLYPMIVCMRAGSEVPVVDVILDLNPGEDKIEISAKLVLLSVLLNPNFVLNVGKFANGEQKSEKSSVKSANTQVMKRQQSTAVQETVRKSGVLRKLLFVRVHCVNFSVLVPEAENSRRLSHLGFDCIAEYSSRMEYYDFRDGKEELIRREVSAVEDFVDSQVQKLAISTGGLEVPSDLYSFKSIKPGIVLAAKAELKLRQITQNSEVDAILSLDIRQLSLLIGFADIRSLVSTKDYCIDAFLTEVQSEQSPARGKSQEIKAETAKTYSVSFFSDEMTAVLIDDTVEIAHSLLRFRIPTTSFSLKYSSTDLIAEFAVSLVLEYRNGAVAAYEPLIENWTLNTNCEQSPGNPLSIIIISRTPLAINFSHAAAFTLSCVLQKLQGGLTSWEQCLHSAQLPTSIVHYKLKNRLGLPLTIWVEDSSFSLTMSPGQTTLISEEIWKIEKQSSGKASNPVHALALQVEPFGSVRGVMVDEAGLAGYVLSQEGKVVICKVELQSKYRVVTFEGDMKVCNNTEQPLTVQWREEAKEILPSKSISIPMYWVFSDILLMAPKRPINFRLCSQFRVDDSSFAVLDRVQLKCDSEAQTVYFINPPIIIRNWLPGTVTAIFQSVSYTIPAGGERRVYTESSTTGVQCAWDLRFSKQTIVNSRKAAILPGKNHCIMTGEEPTGRYEINIECANNENLRCGKADFQYEKRKKSDFSGKLITLQADLWIVNHTSYFLAFADESNTCADVAPSHFAICTFSSPAIKVRLNPLTVGKVCSWSKQFNTGTAGLAGVVSLETNYAPQPNIALGIWVEHGTWPIVNAQILHIYPRFTVKNSLPYAIFLRQHKEKHPIIQLKSDTCTDFQFSQGACFIQVSVDQQSWSGAFNIEDISAFQIRFPSLTTSSPDPSNPWWMPNPVTGPMLCAQVNVTSENQAMITTTLGVPESPDFVIKNETHDYVSVCQQGCKDKTIVAPESSVPFVYDDHMSGKRKVRVMSDRADNEYNIEKIGKSRKKFGSFNVETYVHSASRVLHIYSERDRASLVQSSTSRFANWKVTVQLQSLSVALVDEEPKEIILLSIPIIQGTISSEDTTFQDSDSTEFYLNLTLPSLQIDNMCPKPQEFPVILSPLIRQDEAPTPVLQLEVKRTTERKGLEFFECFEYIRLSLQEVQINIHQSTVVRLAKVLGKVLRPFEGHLRQEPFPEFAEYWDVYPSLKPETAAGEVKSQQRKSYFQLIVIYGAIVNLSIKTSPHKMNAILESSQTFAPSRVIQRLGAALINISNSRLKFTTVMLKDSFSSPADIFSKILQNYLRQGYWQVYRLIGSSDMLGNPIGLINKLGSGVFELFNEPRKGLLQGPNEFASGVRRGVKSFVSNVVSGGMGSVSKITGSFYGLLREAQGDQDGYERINRPDSASSGVLEGLKGGFTDLAEGVTGIFTKPVEGIKKGGFGGFLRGVKSGIVGAVTAPVSAVLRTGTTITSGMANSASQLSNIVPPSRIRLPRQVNTRKVLEPYNESQAEIQASFHSIPQYRKEKLLYYAKCKTGTVVLTQRYFVQIGRQNDVKSVSFEEMSRAELVCTVETGLWVADRRGERVDVLGRREVVLELHAAVCSLAKRLSS